MNNTKSQLLAERGPVAGTDFLRSMILILGHGARHRVALKYPDGTRSMPYSLHRGERSGACTERFGTRSLDPVEQTWPRSSWYTVHISLDKIGPLGSGHDHSIGTSRNFIPFYQQAFLL